MDGVPHFSATVAAGVLTVDTSLVSVAVSGAKRTVTASCSAAGAVAAAHSWSWSAGAPVPAFPTLINAQGMYVLDDSNTTRMLTDDSVLPWLDRAPTAAADFYLFCYGHDYREGLRQLAAVTGRAPLLPRAGYGVWWCECCPQYTSASFSSEVLAEYRNRSLPLTVVVLDMDWHTPGWNHYTWDPTLFPDHTQFVAALRSGANAYGQPLKLAMNIHPGAYQITAENEANYAAFARAMGTSPAANKSFGCNLYDKTYATALMSTVLDPVGMDYYWCVRRAAPPWLKCLKKMHPSSFERSFAERNFTLSEIESPLSGIVLANG